MDGGGWGVVVENCWVFLHYHVVAELSVLEVD